jgi:hypothetical protein
MLRTYLNFRTGFILTTFQTLPLWEVLFDRDHSLEERFIVLEWEDITDSIPEYEKLPYTSEFSEVIKGVR